MERRHGEVEILLNLSLQVFLDREEVGERQGAIETLEAGRVVCSQT